jgi:hypothetical protein
MGDTDTHVDFGAPATLRKRPSFQNERRTDGTGPYLLYECTLEECIRELMAKPATTRHLYEINVSPQSRLVSRVLPGETVVELAARVRWERVAAACDAGQRGRRRLAAAKDQFGRAL